MIRRTEGVWGVLGTSRMELFPRIDMQVGGGGHQVLLDGRSLINPRKTHEEYQMDALKRWLSGEDEAFEEWLAE